jgi:type I restriction enzyme S subunit
MRDAATVDASTPDACPSLPSGWRWVRLGEICMQDRQIIDPSSAPATPLPYLSLEHVESNTGRILREPSEVVADEGKSTTFAFDSRHVLYGKLRPYLNKVALPNYAGRCTTEIIPLLPRNGTDRQFLGWLLRRQETIDAAMRGKTGSRMPRADMGNLFSLAVPCPPLPEQQRIVALLNEQMATVNRAHRAAEASLVAAKSLSAAYLRAVFESREAQRWPRRWVKEFASVSGGIQKLPDRAPNTFHRPFLTVRNVQSGWLDLSDVERFEITPEELSRYRLEKGDLLIVEGNGSLQHIGRNALFNEEIEDCIHQNHLIRVRVNRAEADPEYVSRFLDSASGRMQMIAKAQTTTGLFTLSVSRVEQLEVPLPPLFEQRRIAAKLAEQIAATERMRAALEEQFTTIKQLLAALPGRAFSGEVVHAQPVTVPLTLPRGIAFKRGAIGSYIVKRLYGQKTFGRVQLAKMLYLTEAHVGIDLHGQYRREAAGPLDSNTLYKLEGIATKLRWFTKHPRGTEGYYYRPGPSIDKRVKVAGTMLGDRRAEMDRLLNLFASIDTEQAEIIATLFAAWNDLLIDGRRPDDELILHEVRENWHERKRRFTPDRLREVLAWMREHQLVPRGAGPRTETVGG